MTDNEDDKIIIDSALVKKTTRILVGRAPLAVCMSGHATVIGKSEKAYMIPCKSCQQYTWEDGNYCIRCGKQVNKQLIYESFGKTMG